MNVAVISADTVAEALKMPRAIELMREAFASLSDGKVDVPLRTALTNKKGTVLYKPAYSDTSGIFCVKVVSVFPENASKGLDVCPGIIVANSSETGMPIAMVEAGYLTSLRTGAATGLATDLLAPASAKIAALFGTGGQARHQLQAMLEARSFETVYVFSRKPENAETFCESNRDIAGGCELIPNPNRSVLKQCQVITTATTSPVPLFSEEEISDNCHINAIGSLGKERTEISDEILLKSRIIVDQREACMAEAGEICLMREAGLLPEDFRVEEIGELLNRGYEAEDEKAERTVFKSVGNAVQDLVCVTELLRVAEQGQHVEL